MKTADKPGFYTDDRINDALAEAMDFVATKFFIAGEGWATKMWYLDTSAGQLSIDLPTSAALIKDVRYLFGTVYVPMGYDDSTGQPQYNADSGVRQWAYSYRILDNALYFNPPLAEGGAKFLQLETMAYPKRMLSDTDFMESHFDNAMQHFIKYRTASILAASLERFQNPWDTIERSWYIQMETIIERRNLQSSTIREFCG